MKQDAKSKVHGSTGGNQFQAALQVICPADRRKDLRQDSRFVEHPKTDCGISLSENPRQFLTNPLGTNAFDLRCHPADGSPCLRFYGITKPRAETNGTKQAQLVLFKTLLGVTDGSDNAITNIVLTGNVVDHPLLLGIVEQAVNGEIAALHIRSGIREGNACWAPAIDVRVVRAERRHFKRMPSMDDEDDPELRAHRFSMRKDLHYFRGWSAGRDIVIGRFDLHHHVAHAASDEVCLVSFLTELADDLDREVGLHAAMIPSSPGGVMSFRGVDFYRIDDLLSEEERLVRDTVRRFVDEKVLPSIDKHFEDATFPSNLIPDMAAMGLFGANLPEKYGCANMNNVAYGLIMQELERGDSGLRSFASVQGALVMFPIHEFGSDSQKDRWLPLLAKGEKIGCFGLTEPDHGSDPGGMETRADRVDGGWVLNGTKRWITNGSVADLAIVWAKAGGEIRGFIVETASRGFQAPEIKKKLSLRASVTSDLIMDDVRVPDANVLPKAQGLRAPLKCLDQARFGIAWGALGAAMAVYECAVDYTKGRTQFGQPIAAFQLVQEKLADIFTEITKAQLLAWRLGRLKDEGKQQFAQTSMAKRNNVWMALEAARTARDLMGANGITLEYPVFRHMCNLESVYTYEGTHNIHTLILGEHITGFPAYK